MEDNSEVQDSSEVQEPELEIKILEHDAVVGAIPITWCISRKRMAEFEGVLDRCRVVIITSPLTPGKMGSDKSEWRTAVPLKDMMAYVTFLRPGPSRIFVNIVDPWDLHRGDIDWVLSKKGSGFQSDLLTYHDQEMGRELLIHDHCSIGKHASMAHLDIDMPKECFAKPWPKWVMTWANMLWHEPAIDQCALRKRLIFAFTLQPLLILAVGLVVIIGLWLLRFLSALACTVVGCKGVNWNPVTHPFKDENETSDIWRDIKGSYLYFPRLPYSMSWGPAAVIPTVTLVTAIGYFFAIDLRLGIHLLLITLFGIVLMVAACVLFPVLVIATDWFLFDVLKLTWLNDMWLFRWMDWKDDRGDEREAWKKERERWEADLLVCRKFNFRRIQDLPSQKRTLRLRFKATKAKICRPYPV
jgi:hypothetical protein